MPTVLWDPTEASSSTFVENGFKTCWVVIKGFLFFFLGSQCGGSFLNKIVSNCPYQPVDAMPAEAQLLMDIKSHGKFIPVPEDPEK